MDAKGFNERVRKVAGCWLWAGADRVRWGGQRLTPAQVAWRLSGRDELPEGRRLRTVCDNHLCIRPEHQGWEWRRFDSFHPDLESIIKHAMVQGPKECWPWRGERSATEPLYHGMNARKLAYEAATGTLVPYSRSVYTTCNWDALCVNPAHATLLTRKEMNAYVDSVLKRNVTGNVHAAQ